MHGSHNNDDSKMMWWMMAGCLLLPIVFLVVSARTGAGGVGSNWAWILFIVIFIVGHVAMMVTGHGNHTKEKDSHESDATKNGSHSNQTHT